jgi:hypothetical protein
MQLSGYNRIPSFTCYAVHTSKNDLANNWNIPAALESEVIDRDRRCIYCGVAFGSDGTRKTAASWEHIVNDARIVTRDNIARCCIACNASKGTKVLAIWLKSHYCRHRGITPDTISDVARRALEEPPSLSSSKDSYE